MYHWHAVTDNLSPMFKEIFPYSKIAKCYASAPHFRVSLVSTIKSALFSLAIDGSNNAGLGKMNLMTIQYFDSKR